MKPNTVDTNEYRVVSDKLELPQGSSFYIWPARVEFGQLAAFAIGEDDFLLVGRYYPGPEGRGQITIPGYLILITGNIPVRVLGLVITCGDPPKQITDLPESEYERFFENPFPRSMAC
jgi:hypothetical protein